MQHSSPGDPDGRRLARRRAAQLAEAAWVKQFSERQRPEDIPDVVVTSQETSVVELLKLCFSVSGGEAKRLIEGGGVSLDDERVQDVNLRVVPQNGAVLRAGKRRFARLKTE